MSPVKKITLKFRKKLHFTVHFSTQQTIPRFGTESTWPHQKPHWKIKIILGINEKLRQGNHEQRTTSQPKSPWSTPKIDGGNRHYVNKWKNLSLTILWNTSHLETIFFPMKSLTQFWTHIRALTLARKSEPIAFLWFLYRFEGLARSEKGTLMART